MRTAHSSSRGGVGRDPPEFSPWMLAWTWSPSISPMGVGLDVISLNFPLGYGPRSDSLNFPLGCGPGSDPHQFPPWVWAWTWSPSISPLGVGLAGGSPWQGVSLKGGVSLAGGSPWQRGVSLAGGFPYPPVNRMTNRCKNITLPQTSFAGGKNVTIEKIIRTCILLCGRLEYYYVAAKTRVTGTIFEMTPFMHHWFCQIQWNHWISVLLKNQKNAKNWAQRLILNKLVQFSLNVFIEFSDKIFDYSKRARTSHPATSCVINQGAATVPAWHMWEIESLNWVQFMLQWFIRFLEFSEFLSHLGKTPVKHFNLPSPATLVGVLLSAQITILLFTSVPRYKKTRKCFTWNILFINKMSYGTIALHANGTGEGTGNETGTMGR